MNVDEISTIYEEVTAIESSSPMWLVNLDGHIRSPKGRNIEKVGVGNIVVKGTISQIKSRLEIKKRFMREYWKETSKSKTDQKKFDYNRLRIVNVSIIKYLGQGKKIE